MLSYSIGDDAELRLMMPHHAEVLSALGLQDHAYLSPWLNWATRDFTPDKARDHIVRYLQRLANDEGIMLGIFWQDQFTGWVSHRWSRRDLRTELGYFIGQQFQGKGLMTRSVRAMTDYAFGDIGLQRSEIMVEVGNRPSANVAKRAGYALESVRRQYFMRAGGLRDVELYVTFAAEWASAKQNVQALK